MTLINRPGNFLAYGTAPGIISILPGQAILLPRSADNALSILVNAIAFPWLKGIFVLRFYIAMTNLNCVQFVGTNAAIEKLLPASIGIKEPLATSLYNWYREGPVLVTNQEECAVASFGIHRDTFLFMGLRGEVSCMLAVLRVFAAEDNILSSRSKDLQE